jgi:D-alanine-D-alanine ligase
MERGAWSEKLLLLAPRSSLLAHMHIGFTYDLRPDYLAEGYGEEETAEFDQPGTIEAIETALQALGHDVDRIGHARSLVERLARGDCWELVFNICEGLHGAARESLVPALLDAYEIPYTFADPAVLAVCLDKSLTKTVVRAAGLPTPDWHVVRDVNDLDSFNLPFPVIAKPIAEGTGKGINGASKVVDAAALRNTCRRLLAAYREPVLIERFLSGREFTVGILGTNRDAAVVGTLEVLFGPNAEPEVYSYRNKEQSEALMSFRLVRPSDDRQVAQAEAIALAAWRAVGGRDGGRLDLRCDGDGRPQLMEINPLAGLHPTHSDLPMLCTALGMEYVELIERIVESARLRISAKSTELPAPRS